MPGEKLFFDRLDLQSEFHQLRDERPKSRTHQGGKIKDILGEDSLDQFAHMPDALHNHDPELGKMRPERVCQHRLLADQQHPRAMQHEDSLLAGAFDRHTYPPDGETRAWWGRLKRGYTYLSLQTGIEASAAQRTSVAHPLPCPQCQAKRLRLG